MSRKRAIPDVLQSILLYGILVTIGILMIVPFYWMFILATHATPDISQFPPPISPGKNIVANYNNLLAAIPFWRSFFNSVYVSSIQTVCVILFCSLGGYAFAMYRFPGRDFLFKFLLITMMVPWMAGIIPWFILMKWFGWIDNFNALIIPHIATAFGIFWMRQYTQNNIPKELMDAAIIDGCSEWLIFFRIIFPLLKPATSALAIMTFVNSWNNFMQPLIILKSDARLTLPLALNKLYGDPTRGFDAGALIMGTAMAVLPVLIIFLLAAKKFMAGLTAGAVKG
ncbi:MAG: carbohydrate ABC transporter permease [Treponemataceae bacterium]